MSAGDRLIPQMSKFNMRRTHLVVGIIALFVFAFTGMVMRTHQPRLRTLGDDVRLMYRSRHIYILCAGVANVLLGLYLVPRRSLWRRGLQLAGSLFFLAAPIMVVLAFVAETGRGLASPMWRSTLGLFAMLVGTVLHFLAAEQGEARD